MKILIALLLAAALGYFLGSLNFSIIVVRMMKGEDIRTMGSRNAGLTNTYRCCGPACAGITLVGDLLKGVIAVALARGFASLLSAGLFSFHPRRVLVKVFQGLCRGRAPLFQSLY